MGFSPGNHRPTGSDFCVGAPSQLKRIFTLLAATGAVGSALGWSWRAFSMTYAEGPHLRLPFLMLGKSWRRCQVLKGQEGARFLKELI